MARDLYSVLGVPKTADEDAIRKAFRKQASKYHPDRNPGKENEQRFKDLNHAHEVLSDKEKRSLYDEFGEDALRSGFDADRARTMRNFQRGQGARGGGARGGSSFQDIFGGAAGRGGTADFGDLFGDIFSRGQPGARAPRARKAPDMEAEVGIDFVSSLKGAMVELTRPDGETVTVRIPAGVSDGGRLRIAGQGAHIPGAQPGDLLLTVRVSPHPFFRREGDDLYLDLPITIVEAYEGGKVPVPTPEGEVSLKVRPRTQSGQVTRLKGKGVQKKGKPAGDLYVKFMVQIPVSDAPEVARAVDAMRSHVTDPRESIKL